MLEGNGARGLFCLETKMRKIMHLWIEFDRLCVFNNDKLLTYVVSKQVFVYCLENSFNIETDGER